MHRLLAAISFLLILFHQSPLAAQPSRDTPTRIYADTTNKVNSLAQGIALVYGGSPEYINEFLREAIRLEKRQGIPAAALTAIAILESGGFSSHLFENAKNPFGMKTSKAWKGPTFSMWHEGAMTCFRLYKTPRLAVEDFAAKLKGRRWFADAFKCPDSDYDCFIAALMPSAGEPGYSRDPEWGNKIKSIIKRYALQELEK